MSLAEVVSEQLGAEVVVKRSNGAAEGGAHGVARHSETNRSDGDTGFQGSDRPSSYFAVSYWVWRI